MIGFDALSRRYGPLVAVEWLTVEVGAGEAYAILGPNARAFLRLLQGEGAAG